MNKEEIIKQINHRIHKYWVENQLSDSRESDGFDGNKLVLTDIYMELQEVKHSSDVETYIHKFEYGNEVIHIKTFHPYVINDFVREGYFTAITREIDEDGAYLIVGATYDDDISHFLTNMSYTELFGTKYKPSDLFLDLEKELRTQKEQEYLKYLNSYLPNLAKVITRYNSKTQLYFKNDLLLEVEERSLKLK